MGQGFSATTLSAGSAGIDVPELSDLTYEKSLGTARFMKCIRARHEYGLVIAKVVAKPYADFKLDKYVKTLLGIYILRRAQGEKDSNTSQRKERSLLKYQMLWDTIESWKPVPTDILCDNTSSVHFTIA